jgi:hypothetical protein
LQFRLEFKHVNNKGYGENIYVLIRWDGSILTSKYKCSMLKEQGKHLGWVNLASLPCTLKTCSRENENISRFITILAAS